MNNKAPLIFNYSYLIADIKKKKKAIIHINHWEPRFYCEIHREWDTVKVGLKMLSYYFNHMRLLTNIPSQSYLYEYI